MRNYVVTGCSRSGTTFTAKTFTEFGWRCGHERAFPPRFGGFAGFGKRQGDASWLAAPYLDQLPDDVVVLHQVRHPLETIRSMASRRFLAPALATRSLKMASRRIRKGRSPRNRYRTFVLWHTPSVFVETSVFARAARHWVTWNLLVEKQAQARPYLRYQLEEMNDKLLDAVSDLLEVEAPAPLAVVSEPVNARARHFDSHDLDKLRPSLRDAVKRTAARYGYEL